MLSVNKGTSLDSSVDLVSTCGMHDGLWRQGILFPSILTLTLGPTCRPVYDASDQFSDACAR
jgi:hypothetical protein